jgi:hypothetical protein
MSWALVALQKTGKATALGTLLERKAAVSRPAFSGPGQVQISVISDTVIRINLSVDQQVRSASDTIAAITSVARRFPTLTLAWNWRHPSETSFEVPASDTASLIAKGYKITYTTPMRFSVTGFIRPIRPPAGRKYDKVTTKRRAESLMLARTIVASLLPLECVLDGWGVGTTATEFSTEDPWAFADAVLTSSFGGH